MFCSRTKQSLWIDKHPRTELVWYFFSSCNWHKTPLKESVLFIQIYYQMNDNFSFRLISLWIPPPWTNFSWSLLSWPGDALLCACGPPLSLYGGPQLGHWVGFKLEDCEKKITRNDCFKIPTRKKKLTPEASCEPYLPSACGCAPWGCACFWRRYLWPSSRDCGTYEADNSPFEHF